MRGFVDHLQDAALRDLGGRELELGLYTEQRVNARIHPLFALVVRAVDVKTALVLFSQPLILEQTVYARRLSHALTERLVQNMTDLGSDVDPDFVQQGDRTYRKTPLDQGLIDAFDGYALADQKRRLAQ